MYPKRQKHNKHIHPHNCGYNRNRLIQQESGSVDEVEFYSKEGNPLSYAAQKKLYPRARRWRSGSIYINHWGRILCVKERASGYWGFPKGGSEEEDSDLVATNVRENMEEIGLDLLSDKFACSRKYFVVEIPPERSDHPEVYFFEIILMKEDIPTLKVDTTEIIGAQFLTPSEIILKFEKKQASLITFLVAQALENRYEIYDPRNPNEPILG